METLILSREQAAIVDRIPPGSRVMVAGLDPAYVRFYRRPAGGALLAQVAFSLDEKPKGHPWPAQNVKPERLTAIETADCKPHVAPYVYL